MIQYRVGLVALSAAIALAAPLAVNTVGVASTRGTMEVNSASIRGTANIPNGASVQTNENPGQIRLQNGVQVSLSQKTSATVYSDHLQLLQGTAKFVAKLDYPIDALGYRIAGANQTVSTRVAFDNNRILVSALQSPVTVSKDSKLLAQVNPGQTYYFEADDSTSGPANGSTTVSKVRGLSKAAKWGIVGGAAAAGTAAGVGVYMAGNSASR